MKKKYTLHSSEYADLNTLFKKRREAKTLYERTPFAAIVDDNKKLGVYDSRLFLFQYIEK